MNETLRINEESLSAKWQHYLRWKNKLVGLLPKETQIPGKNSIFSNSNVVFLAEIAVLWEKLQPIKTVLDLGSGIGLMAVFFASLGADSFGIEINPALNSVAEQLIGVAKGAKMVPNDVTCECVQGNYWPKSLEPVLPGSVPWLQQFQERIGLAQSRSNDTYSRVGRELGSFDAFYSFPADYYGNLFSIVSQFGKPGAIFIMSNQPQFQEAGFAFPPNMECIFRSPSSLTIYRKTA